MLGAKFREYLITQELDILRFYDIIFCDGSYVGKVGSMRKKVRKAGRSGLVSTMNSHIANAKTLGAMA